jgi:ribosomal protein L6P/L9E
MRSHLITSALTIALGLATPIALTIGCPEITVAQTVDQRKVEADRLLIQGIEQSEISQYEAAIRSFQQALILYRTSPFHDSEASVLWRIGIGCGSF